jgi:hypothetical protein
MTRRENDSAPTRSVGLCNSTIASPETDPARLNEVYLMFASTHPDEGPMVLVKGRAGVEHALATQLVYAYADGEPMNPVHRDELAALMEQFDDADEWSGCQFMWSFEYGGVCVVRIAPVEQSDDRAGINDRAWHAASPGRSACGWSTDRCDHCRTCR